QPFVKDASADAHAVRPFQLQPPLTKAGGELLFDSIGTFERRLWVFFSPSQLVRGRPTLLVEEGSTSTLAHVHFRQQRSFAAAKVNDGFVPIIATPSLEAARSLKKFKLTHYPRAGSGLEPRRIVLRASACSRETSLLNGNRRMVAAAQVKGRKESAFLHRPEARNWPGSFSPSKPLIVRHIYGHGKKIRRSLYG
ncbi:MAG: hypothetical protein LBV50_00235, partial [Novosphingobium sp.]|nr:hypothetical protein [Novosphingobium sp.]